MITIFNRQELLLTFNMQEQGDVRRLLAQNQIPYKIRTLNHAAMTRSHGPVGTAGWKTENMYEYHIYVHKKDFERAKRVIGR